MWYKLKNTTGNESKFYIADIKLKIRIFYFFSKLIDKTQISFRNFKIYSLIHIVQILYFVFYSVEKSLFLDSFFSMIPNATRYSTLEFLFEGSIIDSVHIILYVLFAFMSLFFLTMFTLKWLDSTRYKAIGNVIMTFLGIVVYPFCQVFAIPTYQVIYHSFCCMSTKSYYPAGCKMDTFNTINSVIAGFLFIMATLMFYLVGNLLIEPNPFANDPLSKPFRSNTVRSVFLNLLLPLIFMVSSSTYRPVGIWVALFLLLLEEIHKLAKPCSYRAEVLNFNRAVHTFQFWICLSSCANAAFDSGEPDKYGIFYVLIGFPFWWVIMYTIYQVRNNWLVTLKIQRTKSGLLVTHYLNMISTLIPDFDKDFSIPFRQALLSYYQKGENKRPSQVEKELINILIANIDSDKSLWYEFFLQIIERCRKNLRKEVHSIFLLAYLNMEIKKSPWRSLAILIELTSRELPFNLNFALYRMKMLLEVSLYRNDTEQDKILDRIVEFEKKSNIFSRVIQMAAFGKYRIWKELKSEQPNILNLNRLAGIITQAKDRIQKLYQSLSRLSENNIKTLEIYGAYLIDVENNLKEAGKVYDRLLYTVRDKKKKRTGVKLESNNMAIIIMSGIYKERGKVLSVNNEATKLFKYSKSEMENAPIENFMPNFYAKHHKSFMSRFYREGTSQILGYKRKVFILNKFNFISPATLYVKIMSSLDDGVHIVGFLFTQALQDDHQDLDLDRRKVKYLMTYQMETGDLKYVCENSYKYLGMRSNISNRMSVFLARNNMKMICPDLFDQENQEAIRVGIKVNFDTSNLVKSNRSLLQELSDDMSQVLPGSSEEEGIDAQDVSLEGEDHDNRTPKNVKKKNKINFSGEEEEEDLDFLYGERELVAQVFHQESFEKDKTFLFVNFQEFQMTEEEIRDEVTAKILDNKEVTRRRRYQRRKRKNLLKRLESSALGNSRDKEPTQELQEAKKSLVMRKNSTTLSRLYILSGIIFLLLSSIFGLKLYLRFDFRSFTSMTQVSGRKAFSRVMNLAKITQLTRKIDLEASGVIFSGEGSAAKIKADKKILSDQLNVLYKNDLEFEGLSHTFDDELGFRNEVIDAKKLLLDGKEIGIEERFTDALNLFITSAYSIEISKTPEISKASETQPPKLFNRARTGIYYITQNGFSHLQTKLESNNLKYMQEINKALQIKHYYSLVVFCSELLIFVTVLFVMIPLLNKVSEISRKLFIFLLHINEDDINIIIKQTNRFIKIYIDQDMTQNLEDNSNFLTLISTDTLSEADSSRAGIKSVTNEHEMITFKNVSKDKDEKRPAVEMGGTGDLHRDNKKDPSSNNISSVRGNLDSKAHGLKKSTTGNKLTLGVSNNNLDVEREHNSAVISSGNTPLNKLSGRRKMLESEQSPLNKAQKRNSKRLKGSKKDSKQKINSSQKKMIMGEKIQYTDEKSKRELINFKEALDEEGDGDNESSFLKQSAEKKKIKIEKFENSSQPQQCKNVVNVCVMFFIFCAISFADFFVNWNTSTDLKWLLENQGTLIELQGYVNLAYGSTYESIAVKKPDYKVNDIKIMEEYLGKMSDRKKQLLDYLSRSYPSSLKPYEASVKSFMFTDMCKNYFDAVKKVSNCNSTLYDSGMDTVIVYLGQTCTTLNSNLQRETLKPNNEAGVDAFMKQTLESNTIKTIDEAALTITDSLLYLNDLFNRGVSDFVTQSMIITAILIGTHIFLLLVLIVIMIAFYLRKLDSEYKRLRTLIGMIPLDFILRDREIREKLEDADLMDV